MFKLMFVVLAVLAAASAQYLATGYTGYPYAYNGLYRSAGYSAGYSAYPYAAYRSGYYGGNLGHYY